MVLMLCVTGVKADCSTDTASLPSNASKQVCSMITPAIQTHPQDESHPMHDFFFTDYAAYCVVVHSAHRLLHALYL